MHLFHPCNDIGLGMLCRQPLVDVGDNVDAEVADRDTFCVREGGLAEKSPFLDAQASLACRFSVPSVSTVSTVFTSFTGASLGRLLSIFIFRTVAHNNEYMEKLDNSKLGSSVPNSSDEPIFEKRRAKDGRFFNKNTGVRRAL